MKSMIILAVTTWLLLSGCGNEAGKESDIIATTSWAAAYANAAGAKSVAILAPYEMEHPSEYELRATDIPQIGKSKLFVYAGYETMVKKIKTSLNLKDKQLLKIDTDYNLGSMEKSILSIANILNTEAIAQKNIDSLRVSFQEGRKAISARLDFSQPVLVNFFQQSLAKELGFTNLIVFGPAPLEPGDFVRLSSTRPILILDNEHNPVGKPLLEILPTSNYILLLNFPGKYQTRSLRDVIRHNISRIIGDLTK